MEEDYIVIEVPKEEITISEMYELKNKAERKIAKTLQALCDETGLDYKSLQVHFALEGHGPECRLIINGVSIEVGFR